MPGVEVNPLVQDDDDHGAFKRIREFSVWGANAAIAPLSWETPVRAVCSSLLSSVAWRGGLLTARIMAVPLICLDMIAPCDSRRLTVVDGPGLPRPDTQAGWRSSASQRVAGASQVA